VRRRLGRAAACLGIVVGLQLAGTARRAVPAAAGRTVLSASQRIRVALITDGGDSPTLRHLVAELRTYDFEVLLYEGEEPTTGKERLLWLTRRSGTVCALTLFSGRRVAQIWIFSQPAGEAVVRDVVAAESDELDSFFTLRVAESLRARFLELRQIDVAPERPPAVVAGAGCGCGGQRSLFGR
jgi:hypothetical protein